MLFSIITVKFIYMYLSLFALFELHGCAAQYYSTNSYMKNGNNPKNETVECSIDGKGKPEPTGCVPVCGVAEIDKYTQTFPWHADLYERYSEDGIRHFKCGATVIHTNFVLTAASCVYQDNTTNTALIPAENLFVMGGTTLQDYDNMIYDPETVWRSAVKDVYIICNYNQQDNSVSDIALVEILKPRFQFSSDLIPVCLDHSVFGEEIFGPGAYGSIGEFKTKFISGSIAKDILSVKTVPYVPYDKCKTLDKVVGRDLLMSDKFCAGDSNRASECLYTRGGGLMFEKNNRWYIQGIVSEIPEIISSDRELTCMNYAIYTNVSEYTSWIEDVILNPDQYKPHPKCQRPRTTPQNIRPPPADVSSVFDQVLPTIEDSFCLAPPQPKNGEWRAHGNPCKSITGCTIPEGTRLKPGSQLVYSCAPGYRANKNTDVYCGSSGKWSTIPVCNEISCGTLNSASTLASCYDLFGSWVSCDSSVPPGTRAEISCRLGYKKVSAFTTFGSETVKCNENGEWAPNAIRCVPVCGIATTHQTPLVFNGQNAKIGDFPWHATLYVQKNLLEGTKKDFICGATIIQSNFLITAAHCVYDERTKTTSDPRKLFVMTGNVFRDYDSPLHDLQIVRKGAVKNVYRPCKYYGLRGNYVSDIALLELEQPFKFSSILLPACLDVEGFTDQILEPGAIGRVAGFGRTTRGASSGILQTLSLPYISYNQCKTSKNADKNDVFISKDKFCAGNTNGSAVCEGDSGGGLAFRKGELWYVLGIVSVGLGVDIENGEQMCDVYSYSLYTKISEHMIWIQDVMFQRAQHKSYPSCDIDA